ncbi:MAG: DUF4185 domain-containing protein [Rikenellaceae bacterium]|nr:DUF4185 domain-containing protein [Rikenellaceae bacterium]
MKNTKMRVLAAMSCCLLLAGLTGCKSDDGGGEPAPAADLTLGATTAKPSKGDRVVSVDITFENFDQLSKLEVKRIDGGTTYTSELYQDELTPEYTYTYKVTSSSADNFTLGFVAVGKNGSRSATKQVAVDNRWGISIANVQCISRVTGKAVSGTGFPTPLYQVDNQTDTRFNLGGTDLGIVWEMDPGKYGIAFGDSYGSSFSPNFNGGGPGAAGGWRCNVLLFSTDSDLSDGLSISGAATDTRGNAKEIIYGGKNTSGQGNWTSIPTAAIRANGIDYIHYMNIRAWSPDYLTNHSRLFRSTDGGQNWTRCENVEFGSYSNFGQVGFAKKDGYVYIVGTETGRTTKPKLARVKEEDIEDQSKYEYWSTSEWVTGNETAATTLFDDVAGELSVAYHTGYQKWIILYFRDVKYGYDIAMRTADEITGPWTNATSVCTGWEYPQLYGSYIHPLSLTGNKLYFLMSMWVPYNVYMMKADMQLLN